MNTYKLALNLSFFFFFQAEDGIRDLTVTGVQTCALPISPLPARRPWPRGGAGRTALATAQHESDLERRAVLMRAQVFHPRRCRPMSHVRPPQEPCASALRAP